MRLIYALGFTLVALCMTSPVRAQTDGESSVYDAARAARLGADDYGMATYYMALLTPGPERSQDSATTAAIQAGHMAHIMRMSESGQLVLAGPFLDGTRFRGVFVFDVGTEEEARALCAQDPAVQSGRLEFILIPWYASAALKELTGIHRTLQKVSFSR